MPVQGRCIGDLVGMEALLQWKKRSISIVGRANPFFGRSCRDLYFFVGWRWDAPQTNVECHERNEIKPRTGINHYISWHQEIIFALVIQIFCPCLSFFLSLLPSGIIKSTWDRSSLSSSSSPKTIVIFHWLLGNTEHRYSPCSFGTPNTPFP